jgi:hypothetical protein
MAARIQGRAQADAMRNLYRPPDRPNEEAPPGKRQGFEAQHEHATGIARQEYRKRPAAGTIRADVLAALEAGESLTSLEAWERFGTSRLAADVFELRRLGWPIQSEEIRVASRGGRPTRVACYRIAEGA